MAIDSILECTTFATSRYWQRCYGLGKKGWPTSSINPLCCDTRIRRGDENQLVFHSLITSGKMPCTRAGWQSDRSNRVFRNYTEPTNSLDEFFEASSPATDDHPSMTAAIPSNPHPRDAERARQSKRLRPRLTAYHAKLFTNATLTTHDYEDGHTETEIKSELPPKKNRAYIIADYDCYGNVQEAHLLTQNLSDSRDQPRFTLIDKVDYPQMIQDSRDAANQQGLHVMVKPEWVDNPKRDESIEVWSCSLVAEADRTRPMRIPNDWNPNLSSLLDAR